MLRIHSAPGQKAFRPGRSPWLRRTALMVDPQRQVRPDYLKPLHLQLGSARRRGCQRILGCRHCRLAIGALISLLSHQLNSNNHLQRTVFSIKSISRRCRLQPTVKVGPVFERDLQDLMSHLLCSILALDRSGSAQGFNIQSNANLSMMSSVSSYSSRPRYDSGYPSTMTTSGVADLSNRIHAHTPVSSGIRLGQHVNQWNTPLMAPIDPIEPFVSFHSDSY